MSKQFEGKFHIEKHETRQPQFLFNFPSNKVQLETHLIGREENSSHPSTSHTFSHKPTHNITLERWNSLTFFSSTAGMYLKNRIKREREGDSREYHIGKQKNLGPVFILLVCVNCDPVTICRKTLT